MNYENKISVRPETSRLINLLEEVKKGRLVVPKFQRDFVWDKKQRIDLFDSISKGFPIGSLLFWNPESETYGYNNQIGPYKLNITSDKYSYVIDGFQRITTLFSALMNPEDSSLDRNDKEFSNYTVFYDLKEEEFMQPLGSKRIPHQVPLYNLVDTFNFLTFSENIKNLYDEYESSLYINRAKKIATILLDYSIAYVNINGGSIQDSVEIFSRINSKGSDMSPMWMLSALTYEDDFKFSEEIDFLKFELAEYNFEDLKTEIILQSIETSTGKIYFDVKTENLAKRKDFKDLCFLTFENIKRAVQFLYNELNVVNYKLLPYNVQLIFVTEFFRLNNNPSDESITMLKRWFWQTTYSNYFTVYSLSKQRKAFIKFKLFCTGQDMVPIFIDGNDNLSTSSFPKTIYYGSVRSKALALFLIKNAVEGDETLKNKDLEDFYNLKNKGKDSEYCFPKFTGKDYINPLKNKLRQSKRNYSYLLDSKNQDFDYKSNFVPIEIIGNIEEANLGELRYNLIADSESKFVNELGIIYEYYFDKYAPF